MRAREWVPEKSLERRARRADAPADDRREQHARQPRPEEDHGIRRRRAPRERPRDAHVDGAEEGPGDERDEEPAGERGRRRGETTRGEVRRARHDGGNASGWIAAASARAASGTRGPARKSASVGSATTRPSRTAGTVVSAAKSARPARSSPIAASTITSGARATTTSRVIQGHTEPVSAATFAPPAI